MPISARAFVRSQIVFLGLGFLALSSIVAVALWLGERSAEIAADILAARDLKTASVQVAAQVQQAESSQRGFLYTTNEVYLAPYDQAKAMALRGVEAFPARMGDDYPELGAAVEKLVTVVADKFAEMDETITLTRQRRTQDALDLVLTNRGKALMDEANVYLTGIAGAADDRLSNLVAEQTENTRWQRLISVVGALVAVAAAIAALWTIIRYAAELGRARDALRASNSQLESKVASRTADLERTAEDMRIAKERAELLVHEVNHRVSNSLAMVSSLVGLQANALNDDPETRAVLTETQSRIHAIGLVHQRLYSSGNVAEVALDDYLRTVLEQFRSTMGGEGRISLNYELEPIALRTDATINLGVIAAEWVMNAAKYAYPDRAGEVRVKLSRLAGDRAVLIVEDDGVGRVGAAVKGTGLGSRIVKAMATSMRGEVDYTDRGPGFSARLAFPLAAA